MLKWSLAKPNTGKKPNVVRQTFVEDKLYSWMGGAFVVAMALLFGYLFARQEAIGFSLFSLVIGFFTFLLCLVSAEAGMYICIVYAFFSFHFSRWLFNDQFPVGVVLDFLLFATFLGGLKDPRLLKRSLGSFLKTPVAAVMIVLLAFMFLQLFNFQGHSVEGWLQSFRRFLGSILLLFMAFYLFDDHRKMKRYLTVIFILATLTGMYGCFQQWNGLFEFERWWIMSNENRFGLYFIMGEFRKFSTMSDPAAYGIAMAICSLLYLILAWETKSKRNRFILLGGVFFMMLGMSYSGTRTANVMLAAGLVFYGLLSMNKKSTQFFLVVMAVIWAFLMYGPVVNSTILRFRSSFQGSQDASYQVRDLNRKMIQPYIKKHPLGGGLGTSGAAGLRFNRSHYLSGFPPDSGYLRKGMETGWIGLGLVILAYFIVLRYGIGAFFRSRFREHRMLIAAALCVIFSLYVGEFAQEAIGQMSDIVVYYPLIAILVKLRKKEENANENQAENSLEY
jgi:hypothetical protein